MIDVATLAAALALVKASGGGGSGEPGFSPTVEIAEVEGGTQVTITDVNGPQTFTVLNGTNGTTPVKGVDYFTEQEVQQIVTGAAAQVLPPLDSVAAGSVLTYTADGTIAWVAPTPTA